MGILNRNQRGMNNYVVSNERIIRASSQWMRERSLGHLCWPPYQYPTGTGPGSQWECYCGGRWEAWGIQRRGDYPINPNRSDAFVGPARWVWAGGVKGIACALPLEVEAGLYDWRVLGDVVVPLLEKIYQETIND